MTDKIAIYAGTFAPITLGHLDIIDQAAALFDQLIIAVSPYQRNDLDLSQAQRIQFIEDSIQHLSNITVIPLTTSIVQCANKHHASWLVRGLRNSQDLAIEQSMAFMNQQLNADLNTVFLQAQTQYQNIQATLVRQLIQCGEDIEAFVPSPVVAWYKEQ